MSKLRRICCVCNRKVGINRCLNCSRCKAVNFCGKACLSRSSDSADLEYHSPAWCSKLEKILYASAEFKQFPFPWSGETTSHEFDLDAYAAFLKTRGVYDQGLWKFETSDEVKYGDGEPVEIPYVLPVESVVLRDEVTWKSSTPTNWKEYYELRGFPIDSPACVLLQWPLTMYHVITHRLPLDYPDILQNYFTTDKSKFCIHIVGVEKEANIFQVFEELSRLLPDVSFDIILVGPVMSAAADGKTFDFVRMKITLRRGNYDEISGLTKADLVLGFNAGLPAYVSWRDTIALLEINRTPAYFTEYCWPAVEFTRQLFDGSKGSRISDGLTNPFRSPIRVSCLESKIPRFSNGVLFHLIYSSDHSIDTGN